MGERLEGPISASGWEEGRRCRLGLPSQDCIPFTSSQLNCVFQTWGQRVPYSARFMPQRAARQIPSPWCFHLQGSGHELIPQETELEEGRVYYVGATRAREALITARKRGAFASYLESGRVYRPLRSTGNKPPRLQFEVGREGDVDRLAHLGWSTAGEIQRILAEVAHLTVPVRAVCRPDHDFTFRLTIRAREPCWHHQRDRDRSIGPGLPSRPRPTLVTGRYWEDVETR